MVSAEIPEMCTLRQHLSDCRILSVLSSCYEEKSTIESQSAVLW